MKKKQHATHTQLVNAAKLWALGQMGRCKVAFPEFNGSGGHEIPDVLAFRYNGSSLLFECKASRSDFLSDKNKWHRKHGTGIGMQKWYVVAPDVINDVEKEIPKGWGCLLYCPSGHDRGYFLRRLRNADPILTEVHFKNLDLLNVERRILIAACARALEAQRLTAPLAVGFVTESDEGTGMTYVRFKDGKVVDLVSGKVHCMQCKEEFEPSVDCEPGPQNFCPECEGPRRGAGK